jgi:hypothetical protein
MIIVDGNTGSIDSFGSTNLINFFVAPDCTKKRQITIIKYVQELIPPLPHQSSYKLLILPVPHCPSVRFINYGQCLKLFEKLEDFFKTNLSEDVDDDSVKYNECNNIAATLCNNVAKLNEICSIEYGVIPNEVLLFLKKYYEYCGFIVCRIGEKQNSIIFAYSHELISKDQLFVPTRHYIPISNLLTYSTNTSSLNSTNRYPLCNWNHVIYSYNTHSKSGNCKINWKNPNYPIIRSFHCGKVKILNKYKIIGLYPNQDYLFTLI